MKDMFVLVVAAVVVVTVVDVAVDDTSHGNVLGLFEVGTKLVGSPSETL